MPRRMYVVSSEDKGVLFVTLNPLRVARIDRASIDTYAAVHKLTPEKVFGQIASAAQTWITKWKQPSGASQDSDIDILVEQGAPASNTDYALVADLRSGNWREDRNPHPPIGDGIGYLGGVKGGSKATIHSVKLFSAGALQPPQKATPQKASKKKKAGSGKKS